MPTFLQELLALDREKKLSMIERSYISAAKRAAEYEERASSLLVKQASGGVRLSQSEMDFISENQGVSQRLRASFFGGRLIKEAAERKRTLGNLDEPLSPNKGRSAFYRSYKDRNAVIEGVLLRERRRTAALSRAGYARAKAKAASHRRNQPAPEAFPGSGYLPINTIAAVIDAVGEARQRDAVPFVTGDPCVDAEIRRQVMAARGKLGKGYRGKRGPFQRDLGLC